jgi:hypothetical protein
MLSRRLGDVSGGGGEGRLAPEPQERPSGRLRPPVLHGPVLALTATTTAQRPRRSSAKARSYMVCCLGILAVAWTRSRLLPHLPSDAAFSGPGVDYAPGIDLTFPFVAVVDAISLDDRRVAIRVLVSGTRCAIRRAGDGEPLTGHRILDRVTLLNLRQRPPALLHVPNSLPSRIATVVGCVPRSS